MELALFTSTALGLVLAVGAGRGGPSLLAGTVISGFAVFILGLSRLRGNGARIQAEGVALVSSSAFLVCFLPSMVLSPVAGLPSMAYARLVALAGFMVGSALLVRPGARYARVYPALSGLVLAVLLAAGLEQMIEPTSMPAHWVDVSQRAILPFRISGLFINPNLWGAFCAVTAVTAFYAALSGASRPTRIALAIAAAIAFVNLAASFSRGAWLAGLAALSASAAWFIHGRRPAPGLRDTLVVLLILIAPACWLLAPAMAVRLQSAASPSELGMHQRLLLYRGILSHIAANFPLGSGLRTFQTLFPRYRLAGGQYVYEAHSDWLQALAEAGLPGLAGIGLLFVVPLVASLKRRDGVLFSFVCAWSLTSCFVSSLHYTFLAVPLFCLLGILLGRGPTSGGSLASPVEGGTSHREENGEERLRAGAALSVSAWICLSAAIPGLLFWIALLLKGGAPSVRALETLSTGELEARYCILEARGKDLFDVLPERRLREQGKLALALFRKTGDRRWLQEARRAFLGAADANPLEVLYLADLAEVDELGGNVDGALEKIDEALQGDPRSERLMLRKARLLEKKGDVSGAVDLLHAALESNTQFLYINPGAYRPVLRELIAIYEATGRDDRAAELKRRYFRLLACPDRAR